MPMALTQTKHLNKLHPHNTTAENITGWASIQMTPDQRIVKDHPNIYLDFNAIAKGYTVDLLGKYLSEKGSKNHLIEIVVNSWKRVSLKSKEPWKIGIDNPNKGRT